MSDSELSSPEPSLTDGTSESDLSGSSSAAESPVINEQQVMSLEVPVEFGIGTSRVTLQELSTIQPGYIFQTDTPAQQPVTIEVSGKTVGTGDLVAIDGRIGVLVREYFGDG